MLVNLRGPSGAGKSFVGWALTGKYPNTFLYQDGWNKHTPRLVGHELPGGLVVMGDYNPAKQTYSGGLEGAYRPFQKLIDLIVDFGRRYPFVLYESLLLSSTYGRVPEITRAVAPVEHVTCVLDTPVEECLRRIYARNGGRPIKEEIVRGCHRRVHSIGTRLEAAGERVEWIDHARAAEQVEDLFRAAGWIPEV